MKIIYHGTVISDLSVIKPFKRFTPGGEGLADTIPPRIYASYEPSYAIAHSFPWSSADGVDISIEEGKIVIVVPSEKQSVLDQKVCLYSLSDESFRFTDEEETGLTYHSTESVTPLEHKCFSSVREAMQEMKGIVRLV